MDNEKRKKYMREYNKLTRSGKKRKDKFIYDIKPASESAKRCRRCRECGAPTQATSYWWCYDHNVLNGVEETQEYVFTYSPDSSSSI